MQLKTAWNEMPPRVASRPRVLMICKYFPPVKGGMEEYVGSLAECVANDFDLTVLAHSIDGRGSIEDLGRYRLIRSATPLKVSSQPLSPAMPLELLRTKYDLIHVHAPNPYGIALALALGRNARIVVTHHADMVGFGLAGAAARKLYARLLKRTQIVTVLSLKNLEFAADLSGLAVQCAALPLGLDPARFAATPDILARKAEIRSGIAPRQTLFAFVGRLVPYKGLDILIRALPDAPDARCLIVGDGRERSALEALASQLKVADRVSFLGDTDETEKIAVLHAADVFVLPSTTTAEAFGIVQVEAQLCGLPIITTALPTGVTEVTQHGTTGIVVPPGDARALAAAMRELGEDAKLRQRLGAAGRARAEANYVFDSMRRRAVEIYTRALT